MDLRRPLHIACARLWFERITVLGREHVPAKGPVFYLGLHRNGLVDGFVHQAALRRPTFMLSSQWRKSFFRRLFFHGIVVTRAKDEGDPAQNAAALEQCFAHLRAGGELDIFPEGTSSLGPRRLPLKTGAARILAAYLEGGDPITVLPVALHYERAWAFRSKVDVVIGRPLDTAMDPALSSNRRMRALHQRIEAALDEVGVNVADAPTLTLVETLAYAATLGTELPYSRALKAFEAGVPEDLRQGWSELERDLSSRRVLRHQGVPLIPTGPTILYALALLLLAPLVGAALLLNLPPVLAAFWAGRALPDDTNVIALWRLLVGVPIATLWGLTVLLAAIALGHPLWFLPWALLSLAGVKAYYRVKKLAVAVHNAFTVKDLGPRLKALQARVVAHVKGPSR